MNIPTLIISVVFMLFAGTWLILQQVRALRSSAKSVDAEDRLRQQVAELEQRVQTLERIATDKQTKLRDQITSL